MVNPKPVLLLDVGLEATGVAVATLDDDGPSVLLALIEPAKLMSTAQQNEERAAVYFGNLAERLFEELRAWMQRELIEVAAGEQRLEAFAAVFAEVPVLGGQSAAAMRAMSLALAAYRCACRATNVRHVDFIRSDVIAAALGTKKVSDETKLQTRALVSERFNVDGERLPKTKLVKHRRTGAMLPCEATERLRDNAYDAAAVLFAARDHEALRVGAGWGDWKGAAHAV